MSDRSVQKSERRVGYAVIEMAEGTETEREKKRERLEKDGRNIIAGGLMRRHNCTINDDRFIRRPGP